MHCLKCGKQLPEGSKFCQYCGEAVAQDPNADRKSEKAVSRGKQKKWVVLSVFAAVFIAAVALCVILLGNKETEKELSPVGSEPTAAGTVRPDEPVSLSEAAASVLYLEVFDENDECIGTASGFLTVSDRTLVTNYHVVEEAHRIVAWTSDAEHSVEANTLLAYDETADLAVLRCDSTLWVEPLDLADSDEIEQGQAVYAIGYSLGIANTMSNGIVSARYIDEQGVDTLQMTAAISEGNSGGPLLNEEGQVIGVVCSYYVYGQNMNMAVASNALKDLLNKKSEPIELSAWVDRPGMPGYEEVEQPEPEGTTRQAAAYSALYDWVEKNYNETWTDGSISYWWGHSQGDWRYDYDIMLYEGELMLRGEVSNSDSRDVVYVTLYPEGTAFPVDYFRYDSVETETADTFGSTHIDAPSFTGDSIIRFTSVEGSTAGLEYLEEIASILYEFSLEFCDNVLRDYLSETTYTIADLGFTSFS